ncbi:unnamed protein product [Trifolium pratense]|uniref:Uncharacterized protein n=1 Tax=Trifolium pratense TaxID=57577 RepID=A0ACB0KL27_TRIPR|nr:unnamed protein product [Trifolium pratense]
MKKLIKRLVGAIEAEEDEEIDQKGLVEIDQVRRNYATDSKYKPKCIFALIWNQLIHHWALDRKFKNISVRKLCFKSRQLYTYRWLYIYG